MTDDETKFDPVTVIVIAELPAGTEAGFIDIKEGTGFDEFWLPPEPLLELPPPPQATRLNSVRKHTNTRAERADNVIFVSFWGKERLGWLQNSNPTHA